jgi:hypothetical protein
MNQYFPLDFATNCFYTEIGESIKQYYPIGLKRESEAYNNHPLIKKVFDTINERMLGYNYQIKPWKKFLKSFSKGYKSKVRDDSFAHELSFSGEITLENYKDPFFTRTKKLVFKVSCIAKYFAIYGIDETVIISKETDSYPFPNSFNSAINVITVSPYFEVEDTFQYLLKEIACQFSGYKFVPFTISQLLLKDLQAFNDDFEESSVHNALFGDHKGYHLVKNIRGDRWFGYPNNNVEVFLTQPKD